MRLLLTHKISPSPSSYLLVYTYLNEEKMEEVRVYQRWRIILCLGRYIDERDNEIAFHSNHYLHYKDVKQ